MPDLTWLKDFSGIVQSILTILAILAGGGFALYKLKQFRDLEPHLTISHTINHRHVGDPYVHIDVTALLHNSSRVKVELQDGYFLLQHITQLPDGQDMPDGNLLYPPWPVLDQASFDLGDQALVIEPGQSLQEVFQFMVPREVEAVLISYFFYDSRPSAGHQRGWGISSVYDILDEQAIPSAR